MRRKTLMLALALTLLLTSALTACSPAASQPTIRVASKDFTEQFIVYLNDTKESLRISIPLPYEPLKLQSYVRTRYPEYFL